MIFRQAKETDIKRIHELFLEEGWKTYTEDLLKKLLNNSNWIIAEENNKIYGFARYISDNVLSIYLCEILVDKDLRGREIGKLIIKKIFEDNPGLRMDLLSDSDSFYKKLNFRELGSAFRAYGNEVD